MTGTWGSKRRASSAQVQCLVRRNDLRAAILPLLKAVPWPVDASALR